MLRITYKTPENVLDGVKIGDEISDEYQIPGTVKSINCETVKHGTVYTFELENGRKILFLR